MELFPSIDLRAGRCVRLLHGDYARETVYGDDPVAVAEQFADAGARWVHVVDLDAARTGERMNAEVVARIAGRLAARGVRVQCGGGVRDETAAAALADAGVTRVVIGTAAMEQPDLVARVAARQPVAVGLDVRGTEVAVRGWTERSGEQLLDVVPRFAGAGAEAVIVTQIDVDGTLEGPDAEGMRGLLAQSTLPVIASGGVGVLDDLRALDRLDVGGRRLAGAIVGRAIYENRFSVADAVAVLAGR